MASRFRGFLPVVIDVECGGFNPNTDALLEIAAVLIEIQGDGSLTPGEGWRYHVQPFPGAKLEAASLAVNGIDPYHPLRPAIPEKEALTRLFKDIRRAMKDNDCTRAILVGHNAYFDLNFLNAAIARTQIKRNPFHPFSSFDTATLGRRRLRPDSAGQSAAGGWHRLGFERGALGRVRRAADGGAVLQGVQPIRRRVMPG